MTKHTTRGTETSGFSELTRVASSISWPDVLGFALVQTWTVLCIALPNPITYGEPFMDLRWLSLFTAATVSLASALHGRFGRFVAQSRIGFTAVGILSSGTSLLGPISALFAPPASSVLLHLAAIGVGTGFAWLYITWYVRFCGNRNMMGLASSVVASLCLTYPLANVLSTDQMSPWISAVVGSLLPVLSVALARKDAETAHIDRNDCNTSLAHLDPAKQLLCVRFFACLFIVVAVVETARNFLLGGTAIAFYAGIANLSGVALKVACAIWLVGVFAGRKAPGVSIAYRVAFMLILGVVLCIPLSLQGNWFAHMLLDVGSFFFHMVVLMVAYQTCVGFEIAPQRFFGILRAFWALAALAGIEVELVYGSQGMQPIQLLPVILGLAVAGAFLFVFTDRDCVEILASAPATTAREQPAPTFDDKLTALAHERGVSDRELEVALLVAKGRSAARIAEMLGVSLATVNSHVHHVYQKLGVHSRQELMDAIEKK